MLTSPRLCRYVCTTMWATPAVSSLVTQGRRGTFGLCKQHQQFHLGWHKSARRRGSSKSKAIITQAAEHKYDTLLQKGKHWTLDAPEGQLLGRAGRRCVLEDGERALSACISMRPDTLSPRVLLMTNLILQNRGREREVPLLAIQTLKKTRLQKCLIGCSVEDVDSCVHVVELGLRALKKAGREQSMRRFVQDAAAAMPALASQFKAVALTRFHVDPDMSVQPAQRQFYDFLTSEDNDET